MINDYKEIRKCIYKGELYSVRDNGAIMRHSKEGARKRKYDNIWSFGTKNIENGYMYLGSHRVHIIVATAFYGEHDSKVYVVDHIDTNRCNNRKENLRWFTKLENALNNEITRNKIIYICGSIEAFIENPNILRERTMYEPSIDWMRTVTKEEAAIAYENIKTYWKEQAKNSKPISGLNINDNIYKEKNVNPPNTLQRSENEIKHNDYRNGIVTDDEWIKMTEAFNKPIELKLAEFITETRCSDEEELVKANAPKTAWQKFWKTPSNFKCCPIDISDTPIEDYYNRLITGEVYNTTTYNHSDKPQIQEIVDKAYIENKRTIIVYSYNKEGFKHHALSKIYCIDGKFIHESIGTYFSEEGARKVFTIEQGLEWTGGDSIDDYC